MDARDLYASKELDEFLKKVYSKTSDMTYVAGRAICSYETQSEKELAMFDIFMRDGLMDRISGRQGYCTYRHTNITTSFIGKGGYRKLDKLNFYRKLNKVKWASLTHIATLIVGFLMGLFFKIISDFIKNI